MIDRREITLVSAMGLNRIIGSNGDLPWHLPADFAHFKSVTRGKPVVMGRLTYESLGRPLPHRRNVVITSRRDFAAEGIEVFPTLLSALEVLKTDAEVMLIGGSGIYKEGLEHATCLQLTVVHGRFEGDVQFPVIDQGQWGVHQVRFLAADEKNPWSCSFYELRRVEEDGITPLPFPFPAGAVFPEPSGPSIEAEPPPVK
jgi:dihydrofolate reductase